MDSRLSLIDLNVNLIKLQYDVEEPFIENLLDLLNEEFPEDHITIEELTQWASMLWEVEELERSFDYCYQESTEYERIND